MAGRPRDLDGDAGDGVGALQRLDWAAPLQGWGKEDVLNWSRLFEPPVSLYEVVRLTVSTLREVYLAHPDDISIG
jgi:hypothetical protein